MQRVLQRESADSGAYLPSHQLFVRGCRGEQRRPADRHHPLPKADVPYSLRHACVSLWIKAGVDPVEVARRAGHSIAVLWRFCSKILRGQQHKANELIDVAPDI